MPKFKSIMEYLDRYDPDFSNVIEAKGSGMDTFTGLLNETQKDSVSERDPPSSGPRSSRPTTRRWVHPAPIRMDAK